MRDRSLGKAKKVGPDPKCQALSQCRNLVGKRQPGTTAGQDPPIGGAGLAVRPDIDISQDRVAKALAAGGPGSSPTSHDSDFSKRPGLSTRAAFLLQGEPMVPPYCPLLLGVAARTFVSAPGVTRSRLRARKLPRPRGKKSSCPAVGLQCSLQG